jgi:hypothetical protein
MATLQATSVSGTLTVSAPFNYTGAGTSLNSIPGTAFNGGAVTSDKIADNTIGRSKIGYAGAVLQTIMIRYDPRPGWSTPTSANGTLVSSMRLTITPTYSNSLIICEWRLHGECASHDAGFRVARNGTVVTGTYAGFNRDTGQNNHSFINSEWYDADDSSTPQSPSFLYYDFPGTTSSTFYDPSTASTDGNTRTYFQNRPISSGGQNNHENGVSWGRITEIRQ